LQGLYRRGLEGRQLQLIVTDGCAGLAAAPQTVYPRVAHQRLGPHATQSAGGSPAARPRRYLWLVLARLIVKGYSCARNTTVVE
jgi:hypothetical protein